MLEATFFFSFLVDFAMNLGARQNQLTGIVVAVAVHVLGGNSCDLGRENDGHNDTVDADDFAEDDTDVVGSVAWGRYGQSVGWSATRTR